MHRRRFLALLGAAITAARTLLAQQKAMPVIGVLSIFSLIANPSEIGRGPVNQALYQAGFVEGQNMLIERRWAEGHCDWLPALAADLVSQRQSVPRPSIQADPEELAAAVKTGDAEAGGCRQLRGSTQRSVHSQFERMKLLRKGVNCLLLLLNHPR